MKVLKYNYLRNEIEVQIIVITVSVLHY